MPQYTEGLYLSRVTSQQLSKNENTGNYQVVIKFIPEAVQDPGGEWQPLQDAEQRTLYLSVTDKSAQMTVDKLADIGLFFDDWWEIDENSDNCVSLVGLPVTLQCRMDEYQGRVRERWDVPRAGGMEVVSLDRSEADTVNALFGSYKPSRGRESAATDNAPPKRSKRQGEAPEASGDNDLAF